MDGQDRLAHPCPFWLQENVDLMTEYMPLHAFKAIYVVDLCKSLCDQVPRRPGPLLRVRPPAPRHRQSCLQLAVRHLCHAARSSWGPARSH